MLSDELLLVLLYHRLEKNTHLAGHTKETDRHDKLATFLKIVHDFLDVLIKELLNELDLNRVLVLEPAEPTLDKADSLISFVVGDVENPRSRDRRWSREFKVLDLEEHFLPVLQNNTSIVCQCQ